MTCSASRSRPPAHRARACCRLRAGYRARPHRQQRHCPTCSRRGWSVADAAGTTFVLQPKPAGARTCGRVAGIRRLDVDLLYYSPLIDTRMTMQVPRLDFGVERTRSCTVPLGSGRGSFYLAPGACRRNSRKRSLNGLPSICGLCISPGKTACSALRGRVISSQTTRWAVPAISRTSDGAMPQARRRPAWGMIRAPGGPGAPRPPRAAARVRS
jgi:hypothetical protein